METFFIIMMMVSAVIGLCATAALILRLRELHKALYRELNEPSLFFFFGFEWVRNLAFPKWLWSSKHRLLGDQALTNRVLAVRLFWFTFHFAVFSLMISVLIDRIQFSVR